MWVWHINCVTFLSARYPHYVGHKIGFCGVCLAFTVVKPFANVLPVRDLGLQKWSQTNTNLQRQGRHISFSRREMQESWDMSFQVYKLIVIKSYVGHKTAFLRTDKVRGAQRFQYMNVYSIQHVYFTNKYINISEPDPRGPTQIIFECCALDYVEFGFNLPGPCILFNCWGTCMCIS